MDWLAWEASHERKNLGARNGERCCIRRLPDSRGDAYGVATFHRMKREIPNHLSHFKGQCRASLLALMTLVTRALDIDDQKRHGLHRLPQDRQDSLVPTNRALSVDFRPTLPDFKATRRGPRAACGKVKLQGGCYGRLFREESNDDRCNSLQIQSMGSERRRI
jgi:hypothetical protein